MGSAHDVNIDGIELVFELSEEVIFGVFEDNLGGVEAFEASAISKLGVLLAAYFDILEFSKKSLLISIRSLSKSYPSGTMTKLSSICALDLLNP